MPNRFGFGYAQEKPIDSKGIPCNCLHGTPVELPWGGCGCDDAGTVTPQVGDNYLMMPGTKRPIVDPTIAGNVQGNCSYLTAPAGYKYEWNGVRCNMVPDYAYNPTQLNMSNAVGKATSAIQNALSGDSGGLLKLAAIGGIGYLLLKSMGGSKGKTRERDVITKTY